jgi:hypothetical protein
MSQTGCCCSSSGSRNRNDEPAGVPASDAADYPMLSTSLNRKDKMDGWKARWGIGRMNYTVKPGLYRVNNPDGDSPVLVTANYKLTVDRLRKELNSIKAWILVLDTKGINVWCAAGKGTFGTDELVRRIQSVQLGDIVHHRKLIVPQLGAPGIAAHEVKKQSGFQVLYGPVYAKDIPRYLRDGMNAQPRMRKVHFTFMERLVLVPMELVPSLRWIPILMLWALLVQVLRDHQLSPAYFLELLPFLAAILAGSVLFQILLPVLPFRSFVMNGWLLGGLTALGLSALLRHPTPLVVIHGLLLPPITAFLSVNFTGATPFTSLSGVQKELAIGVPLMILSLLGGMVYQIITLI